MEIVGLPWENRNMRIPVLHYAILMILRLTKWAVDANSARRSIGREYKMCMNPKNMCV